MTGTPKIITVIGSGAESTPRLPASPATGPPVINDCGFWKVPAGGKAATWTVVKEASATEHPVSHVRARLAGAKDLKEETEECVAVLYLSFGYIRKAGGVGGVVGTGLSTTSPF